jgi:hypothetical protein
VINVVAGFGRCGSSLTMQMLDAGGFPVVGGFPAYENHPADWHVTDPAAFAAECDGKAVKRLDLERWPLPPGLEYKVIWIDRDPAEQAKSALKMVAAMYPGIDKDRTARRKMAASYVRDRPKCLAVMRSVGADVLILRFEDLINDTTACAVRMANHLGADLSLAGMILAVRDRGIVGTKCLPGFLELQLIAEHEGRALAG